MSKYTTEVRFICEVNSGLTDSVGYNKIDEVISKSLPKIFDFNFPIFDEKYRTVLETKILKHYYTREICEETVGLWKLRLNTRLNEIMPYYNKLYESELLTVEPFNDTNYTRKSTKKTVGKIVDDGVDDGNKVTTNDLTTQRSDNLENKRTDNLSSNRIDNLSSATVGSNKDKYSDTPQGSLSNLASDTYLTNARIVDNTATTTDTGTQTLNKTGTQTTTNTGTQTSKNTGTIKNNDTIIKHNDRDITNTDEYIESIIGKVSSENYSDLLIKYRNTFLNIDMLVIRDLDDLFFNLW